MYFYVVDHIDLNDLLSTAPSNADLMMVKLCRAKKEELLQELQTYLTTNALGWLRVQVKSIKLERELLKIIPTEYKEKIVLTHFKPCVEDQVFLMHPLGLKKLTITLGTTL